MNVSKEKLAKMVTEVIENEGFEFVDMKLARHGKHHSLRVFADAEGGITLDQCGALSRSIGRMLDDAEPFESAYTLEVSSPGLDRPLTTAADFKRRIGERVRIQLNSPLDDKHQIEGLLAEVEDNRLVCETQGGKVELTVDQIKRGKVVF